MALLQLKVETTFLECFRIASIEKSDTGFDWGLMRKLVWQKLANPIGVEGMCQWCPLDQPLSLSTNNTDQ